MILLWAINRTKGHTTLTINAFKVCNKELTMLTSLRGGYISRTSWTLGLSVTTQYLLFGDISDIRSFTAVLFVVTFVSSLPRAVR